MPKWVKNVLFGVGVGLAIWLFGTGKMVEAGTLVGVLGFALAYSTRDKPEKPK
jgi:hypothetical protein